MISVAERIDHRHAAVFRQAHDVAVWTHSGDHAGCHGRYDDAGVAEGLIDTQLDVGGAKEERVAGEHGDGGFAGDAGAGGAFGEEEGDGLVLERAAEGLEELRAVGALAVRDGVVDQDSELLGGEVGYGEEMAGFGRRGGCGDGGGISECAWCGFMASQEARRRGRQTKR